MPIVTYHGLHRHRNYPDYSGEFTRGQSAEFTTEWLDKWHNALPADQFTIEGYEPPTVDEGGDGLPDKSWRVADIRSWLATQGATVPKVAKKASLLNLVSETLDPAPAPPEPAVEEVVEAPVEEEEAPAPEVVADGTTPSEQE